MEIKWNKTENGREPRVAAAMRSSLLITVAVREALGSS